MKKYQQGGYPLPNFWEAGLESLNFDMYKNAFDARTEFGNAFQNQQNAIQPPTPPKYHWYEGAAKQSRKYGKYQEELKAFNDKKAADLTSYKQTSQMMLPLGMLMQGQQGYMDYLSKPKENLQEEQGFYGFKQGGNVNKTGYLTGSSTANNPYNTILGSSITMHGVNHPVYGVSNMGEKKMMYPGNNYNFKGADYVTEYPMRYQEGGPPSGQGLQKFEDYKLAEEDLLNIPQHALMEALTGRRKSPSEILYEDGALDSTKTSHKILGTLFDLGIDPLNYIAGPRNIGMKGEQLGLTTLGKYIQAGLTGDNIRDIYSGLSKGESDKKYKKIDPQNDKKTKIENKQEGGEMPYYQNGGIVEGEYDLKQMSPAEMMYLRKKGYKIEFI